MQFLPALSQSPNTARRETSAGIHLPYARHVDERTLEMRDGLLMQTIKLGGFLFETSDADDIAYRAELRDAMLRALGTSRFAVYQHAVRRKAPVALDDDDLQGFAATLNQRWNERVRHRELYVNDLFLTVVLRPLQGRLGIVDRVQQWLGRASRANAERMVANRQSLSNAVDALISALGSYSPQLLTCYDTEQGMRSEPLEFLSYLFNHDMRPVNVPAYDLGHHIPARRISFGKDTVERAESGPLKRTFTAMVSIKDWPGQAMPGMFDELLRLPFEMDMSQSFAFVERSAALSRINLALRRMRSTEDEALSLRGELGLAKDDVASGRAGFGEHHNTIAVHAETLEQLNAHIADVIAVLADLGITAVREDIGLEPSFWGQFPGNFKYLTRRGLISTTNFASFASMHNFPVGKAFGNHWGDAVTLFETTAAGPYFFNFHQNDLGNFTVIGPSGSGKTVLLNFLMAQAQKFKPKTILFDKDRGAELFVRAIGGSYDRLQQGTPSGLNPMQLDDSPANRIFLLEWLTLLAGDANAQETKQLRDALETSFLQPQNKRRLRYLVELLRGSGRPTSDDLYARLRPWWGDGERAWLFDNAEDTTDISATTIGFDMTDILDDAAARTPAMFYFFHRIDERLDGTPSIIVIDEGWKALDDDVFVNRLKEWQKTIRKQNGIVGFATQSAQDALESRISSAIIEQAATQIFTVNPKARAEDYMDGFGLSAHEFSLIKTLPDSAHCFLVRNGRESVIARLDLSGEREILTILSGRESTVRLFDELVPETGTDPDDWMPELFGRAA